MTVSGGTRVALFILCWSMFFGPMKPVWLLCVFAGTVLGDYVSERRRVHTFELPGGGTIRVRGASYEKAKATADAFAAARKRGEA